MDKESQDAGFDSDGEIGQFLDAVTGEETAEAHEEELVPKRVVPEDETATVEKNPIANATVDADGNVDAAENLPSVDYLLPTHFIFQNYQDKTKVIYLNESIKARGLMIAGKKEDLKLRLHQVVAAGVEIISEEETQQQCNQMEGIHPAARWEELKYMDEPVDYPGDDEEFRELTVPEWETEQRKYNYHEAFERPDFQELVMLQ